jgi:putative two-component system response regulator
MKTMGQNMNSYDDKMEVTDGRILIIDDESGNIAILERVLKGSGFNNIKSISDPRLAVTTYDEYRPDLVLLDLNIPHVNGFEVIDQLKKAQNRNH